MGQCPVLAVRTVLLVALSRGGTSWGSIRANAADAGSDRRGRRCAASNDLTCPRTPTRATSGTDRAVRSTRAGFPPGLDEFRRSGLVRFALLSTAGSRGRANRLRSNRSNRASSAALAQRSLKQKVVGKVLTPVRFGHRFPPTVPPVRRDVSRPQRSHPPRATNVMNNTKSAHTTREA